MDARGGVRALGVDLPRHLWCIMQAKANRKRERKDKRPHRPIRALRESPTLHWPRRWRNTHPRHMEFPQRPRLGRPQMRTTERHRFPLDISGGRPTGRSMRTHQRPWSEAPEPHRSTPHNRCRRLNTLPIQRNTRDPHVIRERRSAPRLWVPRLIGTREIATDLTKKKRLTGPLKE